MSKLKKTTRYLRRYMSVIIIIFQRGQQKSSVVHGGGHRSDTGLKHASPRRGSSLTVSRSSPRSRLRRGLVVVSHSVSFATAYRAHVRRPASAPCGSFRNFLAVKKKQEKRNTRLVAVVPLL